MRIETVVQRIKERRRSMEEGVFSKPPVDHAEFMKQQGIWQGLGDALSLIAEEARKDSDD